MVTKPPAVGVIVVAVGMVTEAALVPIVIETATGTVVAAEVAAAAVPATLAKMPWVTKVPRLAGATATEIGIAQGVMSLEMGVTVAVTGSVVVMTVIRLLVPVHNCGMLRIPVPKESLVAEVRTKELATGTVTIKVVSPITTEVALEPSLIV